MSDVSKKTVVYIEVGPNLKEVFTTAIEAADNNSESIYDITNMLSSRIESLATTAIVNQTSTE